MSGNNLLGRDDRGDGEINGGAGPVGEGENFGEWFGAELGRGLGRRQNQGGCAVIEFGSVSGSYSSIFLKDRLETGEFTVRVKKTN